MARVELEVDRNVLELTTMLPDPPEIDRVFYADVWQPQEIRHGQILDELQVAARPAARRRRPRLARPEAQDPRRARPPRRLPGRLPDALLPDRHGHRALRGAGLQPAARRRRRDGRDRRRARRSSRRSAARSPATTRSTSCPRAACGRELAAWQKWLVRRMRSLSFAPVGANNDAAEGRLRRRDGDPAASTDRLEDFAEPDLPGRARAALGARPAASRSRTTSPPRSARPSSWPRCGGGLTGIPVGVPILEVQPTR